MGGANGKKLPLQEVYCQRRDILERTLEREVIILICTLCAHINFYRNKKYLPLALRFTGIKVRLVIRGENSNDELKLCGFIYYLTINVHQLLDSLVLADMPRRNIS